MEFRENAKNHRNNKKRLTIASPSCLRDPFADGERQLLLNCVSNYSTNFFARWLLCPLLRPLLRVDSLPQANLIRSTFQSTMSVCRTRLPTTRLCGTTWLLPPVKHGALIGDALRLTRYSTVRLAFATCICFFSRLI